MCNYSIKTYLMSRIYLFACKGTNFLKIAYTLYQKAVFLRGIIKNGLHESIIVV